MEFYATPVHYPHKMKSVKLLHNPGAGEAEHSKKNLISHLRTAEFDCSYSSTKEDEWEESIPYKTDFIAIAGGDGTVRKLARHLLNRRLLDKRFPIGLIPLGTANNIARTLGISGTPQEIVANWKNNNIKKIDIGRIYNLRQSKFFMEGLGYGVFPRLMRKMKDREHQSDDPEAELRSALRLLHEIILTYRAKHCRIKIDGKEYVGNYLMVEVMNVHSIGPNLNLNPNSDPSDGQLEVILVTEEQRDELAKYVLHRLENGKEEPFFHIAIPAKKIEIAWDGGQLHTDDQLIPIRKSKKIKIDVEAGLLDFIV